MKEKTQEWIIALGLGIGTFVGLILMAATRGSDSYPYEDEGESYGNPDDANIAAVRSLGRSTQTLSFDRDRMHTAEKIKELAVEKGDRVKTAAIEELENIRDDMDFTSSKRLINDMIFELTR